MMPLRITIRLAGAMMRPRHLLHLDAVLAALRVQQAEADGDPDPWARQHDLPLARWTAPCGQWVFCASAFHFDRVGRPVIVPMTARTSVTRLGEDIADGLVDYRASAINPAGGTFKSSAFGISAQLVTAAHAECIGEMADVTALLTGLEFLGARRAQAFGRVAGIEVTPVLAADWLARVMPASWGAETAAGYALAQQCLRPPYWQRGRMRAALVPLDML